MFRRLLSTYPKYTIHSPQYKVWSSLEKDTQYRVWGYRNIENKPVWGEVIKTDTEYGFKREIVPSDLKYKEPKNEEVENWDEYLKKKKKKKTLIWEGWIP